MSDSALVLNPALSPDRKAVQNISGELYKRGKFNTAWKKRWFQMEGDTLHYYKGITSKEAAGHIPLDRCHIRLGEPVTHRGQYLYTFQLCTHFRTYYLAARSSVDRKRWVETVTLRTAVPVENATLAALERKFFGSAQSPQQST